MADGRYNLLHSGAEIDTAIDQTETNTLRLQGVTQTLSTKLDKTEQATDSAKLGGQLPDHYASVSALNAVEDAAADALDEVRATAEAALPANGTAADSSKLGGKSLAEIMLTIYPVGAVYISTVGTSPATLFGGAWAQIQNVFLLAAGSGYAAGSTGGEATHTLTVGEMPSHNHTSTAYYEGAGAQQAAAAKMIYRDNGTTSYISSGTSFVDRTGSGQAHNNMPPYEAVYMWKRTA